MPELADRMPSRVKVPTPTATNRDCEAKPGALFVFEGPDGVGKSTLVAEVQRLLSDEIGRPVVHLAFPGCEPGTLGHHVHELHHDPARFGIDGMTPTSLQLLHMAAHVDAIETFIRPGVARGEVVLLDRYWWSTWVYGVSAGVDPRTLRAMIEVECTHWGDLKPAVVLLICRRATLRDRESRAAFERWSAEYAALAETEAASTRVVAIDNDRTIEDATRAILEVMRQVIASLPRG